MLTVGDVADKHPLLAERFDHRRSVQSVVRPGHPWPCQTCGTASLLCYRCSSCGADLAGDG